MAELYQSFRKANFFQEDLQCPMRKHFDLAMEMKGDPIKKTSSPAMTSSLSQETLAITSKSTSEKLNKKKDDASKKRGHSSDKNDSNKKKSTSPVTRFTGMLPFSKSNTKKVTRWLFVVYFLWPLEMELQPTSSTLQLQNFI